MDPVALTIVAHMRKAEAGTFSTADGSRATAGFAYNPTGTALLTLPALAPALDDAALVTAVHSALRLTRAAGAAYVGTWRHPSGELVFLHTEVTTDEAAARAAVLATGQLAYFDLTRGREVRV